MFSSNQILEISGCLAHKDDLYKALEFALKYNDHLNSFTHPTKTDSKCVYQITEDGRYCLGWAWGEPKEGWLKYPFDFDLSIISQIIAQHLGKQDIHYDMWDGSYEKGFLMKAIEESMGSEVNGIKNPFYGIVEFSPYTCFYSK